MLDTVIRWGGILVAPRATLRDSPASQGRWDGVLLAVIYVLATQLVRLAEGLSGFIATRDLGGVLLLLQSLGRGLLPPVLVVLAVETLLGDDGAHRRGLFVVPLVFMGSLAAIAASFGHVLPGPSFVAELLGAAWGIALAVMLRGAVASATQESQA